MVSSGTAVVAYAALSSVCLLCQLDEIVTEVLATGASHPLSSAMHRASRGELSGDAAKAAGALLLSHVVKDQISTFAVINFVVSMYALIAFLTKEMFLGSLSAIEAGKLSERMLKFLMLKLVFIAAVSGPGMLEVVAWVSWFAAVGWLKMFVGLARDRFDSLISSPSATFAAHARTLALLALLFANDVAWIAAFVRGHAGAPPGHLALCLFDVVVAALEAAAILVKYGIYMADQFQESQDWQGKGDFLYKVELATDMAVKSLTLSHLTHIWWLHGFAFRLLDAILFLDIRHLFRSICSGVRQYLRYRQASHNLNHQFQDADACMLEQGAKDCVVCCEHMTAAKVLPCGHMFHLSCLTAWLQQSGSDNFTCPLCRKALFIASSLQDDELGSHDPDESSENLRPSQLEHDVEAETFSSQVVGQALAEAARQLAEGGNTLFRQNWPLEIRRLELMVQTLRARLLRQEPPGGAVLLRDLQWTSSRSFASAPLEQANPIPHVPSMHFVEELERQLDNIKDSLANSACPTADLFTEEQVLPVLG